MSSPRARELERDVVVEFVREVFRERERFRAEFRPLSKAEPNTEK